MPVELKFESRCASVDRSDRFHRVTSAAGAVLTQLAERAEAPAVSVTVVFTDDFVGTVDEFLTLAAARLDSAAPQPYTTDRVGGIAAARNVVLAQDASETVVVINANHHRFGNPQQEAHSLLLAAHELGHPLLNRLRAASGALDTIAPPATATAGVARNIVRGAVDEYRCDVMADIFLGAVSTTTVDGETRPLRTSDVYGGIGHLDYMPEMLDTHVYPAWPDLVQSYREGRIPLGQMMDRLTVATNETMTALAHAQAEADSASAPGPVHGDHADHPGVRLYLAPAWTKVMEAVEAHPLLPTLAEFAAVEHAVLAAGEKALLAMWHRLGITASTDPSGSDYLHVGAPSR